MEVRHRTWSFEVRQQKRCTCERLDQGNHLCVTVAVTVTVKVEAAATETGTVEVEVVVTGNALSVGSVTPSTSLASPLMVTNSN